MLYKFCFALYTLRGLYVSATVLFRSECGCLDARIYLIHSSRVSGLASTNRLQRLLRKRNTLALEDHTNGVADLLGVRDDDSRRVDDAVEYKLGRDTTRHTDEAGHRGVATGDAVVLKRRGDRVLSQFPLATLSRKHRRLSTYDLSIRPLHDELVLQHDEIALALGVRHERLELRTERVEEVARAGLDLLA